MDLQEIELDLDAAEDGAWFPIGDDFRVRLAMWNNKAHAAFLREVGVKYGRRLANGKVPEEKAKSIMAEQWKFLVLSWEGLTDQGEEVPYSHETLTRLAADKKYKAFFDRLENVCRTEENFRRQNIEELGETSPTT